MYSFILSHAYSQTLSHTPKPLTCTIILSHTAIHTSNPHTYLMHTLSGSQFHTLPLHTTIPLTHSFMISNTQIHCHILQYTSLHILSSSLTHSRILSYTLPNLLHTLPYSVIHTISVCHRPLTYSFIISYM